MSPSSGMQPVKKKAANGVLLIPFPLKLSQKTPSRYVRVVPTRLIRLFRKLKIQSRAKVTAKKRLMRIGATGIERLNNMFVQS